MEQSQTDFFVGRQPIVDRDENIYGYELLFRGGLNSSVAEFDSDSQATATVICNSMMEMDIKELVGKSKAFINFPEEFFYEMRDPCFHPRQVVIEVLETVEPNQQVIESLQYLKDQGYILALDDFIFSKKYVPFIKMADIVKFDVLVIKPEKIKPLFTKIKSIKDVTILAERVENKEMYDLCKEAGADLFQGYYFAKPEVVTGKKLSVAKIHLLELLKKVVDESLHLDDLESIIEKDVGLSIKILKLAKQYKSISMPNFSSLKEVMMLFGLKRVQSWATMISMTSLDDVFPEVFNLARLRAIFMRNIAQKENLPAVDSFYLAGLFSMIDVILGQNLDQALDNIPLNEHIKNGVLNGEGEIGRLLKIAKSFELNNADDHQDFALLYLEAIKEVNKISEI
ncbi:EAL and HDOD domain-containing protein [Thiomicrorhabdus lithotrophica]|uniref:EAL domain-containing protein n=1 Tax=Thiomicrorhabdus lithotrophica TaxID=2949997 RepID=A0ABY8CE90_9GAMM|nr:EAL domain-containing protein [Thiomicrorhabdus lithotrophica]WEJ62448.1 EAL domain-containing protein [Thiomicrorhabdus lithotrophica]